MSVQQFSVVLKWDSDDEVWVTQVPALDHLSTYGHTREVALEATREAIIGYLEAAAKEGGDARRDRTQTLITTRGERRR